ncbi:protein YhfH [Ammoniphilus oxalaticus]|nr:protein YhfH [Ammoniphilus oxalaticus]
MLKLSEFFRALPDRCCSRCGNTLIEQADCYVTECPECDTQRFYRIYEL